MAPAMPNQKRKRGRPSNAQVAAEDAPQRAIRNRNAEKAKESLPPAEAQPSEDAGATPDSRPRKRGRPKKDESNKTVADDSGSSGVRRSKRDRRSADDQPWWISGANDGEAEQEEPEAPPKKRSRTSQVLVTAQAESPKPKPRAKRTEKEPIASQPGRSQPSRRGRQNEPPVEEAPTQAEPEPEPEPKRRGRPRTSNVSAASLSLNRTPNPKSAASMPRPKAQATGRSKDRDSAAARKPRTKPAGRQSAADRSIADRDNEPEASLPPAPKFQQIQPRTRQIPRSTISNKWTPLDEAAIEAVSSIISDTSRPVLLRLRDNQGLRYQQGQSVLQLFASRLRSKLRKGMPFPPATKKALGTRAGKSDNGSGHSEELNFESTVDSVQTLKTMLDPLLHSVALLEKEKDKEESGLENDYENLRTLEKNAQSEAREWRERARKAHALAPSPGKAALERSWTARLSLAENKSVLPNGVFHDIQDEELLVMSRQIANHMETMRGNLQPVLEILPAMDKSRAALQSVLQTQLRRTEFERVLLG